MNNLIKIPNLLLPNKNIDMTKWATIACDQYTSELNYWHDVEEIVKDSPSSYYLMLPEIYLEEEDVDKRIEKINKSMDQYIDDGTLQELNETAVIVERSFLDNPTRTGILLAINLDEYDFKADSKSLIRATEGTVEDRLPPRMKIRKNASLEMPHILVLINDPEKKVIEPVRDYALKEGKVLYDFPLMKDSGSIKGYPVSDKAILDKMEEELYKLKDETNFLFAVGDGNHSLASAKCYWDQIKEGLSQDHNAKYALCEIINIHDKGIIFEPIHRILFDVNADLFFNELQGYYGEQVSIAINYKEEENSHPISFVSNNQKGTIYISKDVHSLAQGALQAFLDYYIDAHPETKIDYIHGIDSLMQLSKKQSSMAFILGNINKDEFFSSIMKNGPMPRKTFSLGEAHEKRFYLEGRKIK